MVEIDWSAVIMLSILLIGFLALVHAFAVHYFEKSYHSETRAFSSGDLRCDYYLEYVGNELVNVTRTFCIDLKP